MTREEIDLALKRLGANRDAVVLLDLLRTELRHTSGPGIADGALRHRDGRRTFASELIARLSPDGAETKSGRTDASTGPDAKPGPRRAGARRRVAATDPADFPEH